jgi:hypothetical protein
MNIISQSLEYSKIISELQMQINHQKRRKENLNGKPTQK